MKRGLLLLLGAVLFVAGRAQAQDASVQDDMRFIEELRKQGKSDLALEYLEKVAKNASPELAKALPLEMARTRLEAAGEEPDSAKRLALYGEARDEFQKWLQANPADPHASEVKLDLAHVTVQQGRTQLSRAFLNEDFDTQMTPEAGKARAIFEDAGAQLKQAAKDLDAQIAKAGEPKTPADKELRKKLDRDRMQADLDVALNVFDQGQTYPLQADPTGALSKARNKLYQDAQALFEKLGARDDQNPICWTAKAWAARCIHMLGDFPKAKQRYQAILRGDPRYAADAIRLTRYFYLLLLDEAPIELRDKATEDDAHIVAKCKEWISAYPGFLRTPEGYGIRFLLGEEDVKAAAAEKDVFKRKEELADARKYFRQVEESENDFTDRARREKIEIIAAQQGGFKEPVEKLTNFEDCYVRAEYEMIQEAKGEKEAKTPEDADKVRQEHGPVIVAALERGLKLDEQAKGRGDDLLELANAKAMMIYQYMNAKKYHEAIAVGEKFAKSDPRSSQAAAAAVYVLLSYVALVGQEAGADKPPAELPADRKGLFDFAQYMERTWPKEPAGDMVRDQLALLYINAPINSDDPDAIRAAHAENVHKAIEVLGQITPNYAQYTPTQYLLAQFCFNADKEKLPPLPGDGEDGYRKRALAALENVPEPSAGADPTSNKVYFLAKFRLAQEDFTLKKYDELETLTEKVQKLLPQVKLAADDDDDKKVHGEFEDSFGSYAVLARWGRADAEARAADKADPKDKPAHYANVLKLLDPVVDDIKAHKHPELKNNQPLRAASWTTPCEPPSSSTSWTGRGTCWIATRSWRRPTPPPEGRPRCSRSWWPSSRRSWRS